MEQLWGSSVANQDVRWRDWNRPNGSSAPSWNNEGARPNAGVTANSEFYGAVYLFVQRALDRHFCDGNRGGRDHRGL